MHTITAKNVHEAEDAIRDILLMYVDMASSYHGFGHAVDAAIRFDPLRFIDAEVEPGNSCFVNVDLLRTGSAVVILCRLYDCWCEHEGIHGTQADIYRRAVEKGQLHFNPDIAKVILEASSKKQLPLEDPWFEDAVKPIYRKHIQDFFSCLAALDR